MINFTADEIKILIGHQELEKYDMKLKLDKANEIIAKLINDNNLLKNENINLRESIGKDLENS